MSILSQLCALAILYAILGFYASKRKISLNTGRNYLQLVVATVICASCDLLSIYFIDRIDVIPEFIVYAISKLYLVTIFLVAYFGLRYIFSDIYKKEKAYHLAAAIAGVWYLFGVIVIFLLPINIHYTDGVAKYTEGPATLATYIFVFVTILSIIFFLMLNRVNLNYQRRNAVYFWLGIWVLAAVIQFFNNDILIVSFGASLGIMVIYFALENPESNIDRVSGLFNENALMLYCEQKFNKKDNFALFNLNVGAGMGKAGAAVDADILKEVLKYLRSFSKGDIFKISANDYTLAFDSEKDAKEAFDLLRERMLYSWGIGRNVMLNCHFTFFPDTFLCKNVNELQEVYSYATHMAKYESKPFLVTGNIIEEMYAEQEMEKLIQDAIEKDRVEPFYQPIYNVAAGKITAAEALVRIKKEDGSLVNPADFIPLAERNGMIISLGEVIFEKVCRFIAKEKPYEKYGLEYIEVNLSTVQAGYESLADSFISIMEREHVEAKYINLEITETASIGDRAVLLKNMKQLRLYGATFSLDDFGTGLSNLNYVMDMPVDIVKFDREMTQKYFVNDVAKRLMTDTIQMLKGMELSIVAEGVEDEKTLAEMTSIGVDYIQGFYFSAPLPRRDFCDYLISRMTEL